jgi:hypothetical protein
MEKFWTNDIKGVFRRHPVWFTARLSKLVLMLALFVVLTVIIGGMLILTDRENAWRNWWLP